jgi:dephospho-CoA kinase
MTYRIGLTGVIGSGKSLAAEYFANLGIVIVDTDAISHSITGYNAIAIEPIVEAFGLEYLKADGSLNRDKMRQLVFGKDDQRLKLESILHPLIFNEVVAAVEQSSSLYTIVMVPLLFQSPRYLQYVQRSIFVDCNEETIIARVAKRNNLSRDMVLAILKSQLPRDKQLALANDVLDNNRVPFYLQEQVNELDKKYKIRLNG